MNIPIFLNTVPKEYMQITKKTTVKSIRKFLEKYNFDKIEFFVNDKTESKIFDSNKYDNFDLSSIWKQLKNPAIYLTSAILETINQFGKLPKDLLKYKFMLELNDRDLLNFCQTDSLTKELCKDENFWKVRFINKFRSEYKPESRSWRNHYLKVITDLEIYEKDPWMIFKYITWDITKPPNSENVKIFTTKYTKRTIKNSLENFRNAYWLLNLGKEIKIAYPVYRDFEAVVKSYKNEKGFTPPEVLRLIYEYYQSPLTKEEYEQIINENPFFNIEYIEHTKEKILEDIENKKITKLIMIKNLKYLDDIIEGPGNIKFLQLGI